MKVREEWKEKEKTGNNEGLKWWTELEEKREERLRKNSRIWKRRRLRHNENT